MSSGAKVAILAEMVALLGAGLLSSRPADEDWLAFALGKGGLGRVIAVGALLVFLMLLADLGLGLAAATFGAVVLISYLGAHGAAGSQVLDLERRVFGR